MEGEGEGSPDRDRSARGGGTDAGEVAGRNTRRNDLSLDPEECDPRNSKDPTANPQTPRPLVEDPRLRMEHHPRGEKTTFYGDIVYQPG